MSNNITIPAPAWATDAHVFFFDKQTNKLQLVVFERGQSIVRTLGPWRLVMRDEQ